MHKYFELLTTRDMAEVKAMHPKEAKMSLAEEIVTRYHGSAAAGEARTGFDKVFANKDLPDDIEEYVLNQEKIKLSDLLVASGLVASKNEARRLITQGGVKINQQKTVEDCEVSKDGLSPSFVVQAGKLKFKKIV
ncbi:MAG: S4 domain-containing protein, partial [Elusimicrobia bacterium]|nr:S4 domain-containing protein [Elusimicrobiota bacterium]